MIVQIRKVKLNLSKIMGKMLGDQKSKQEITITYMMMCIISVFLITQFPYYIKATLLLTRIIKPKLCGSVPVLDLSSWIFIILNSSVNTIIYCFFNKSFRDVLIQWLPSKLRNRFSSVSTNVTTKNTNDIEWNIQHWRQKAFQMCCENWQFGALSQIANSVKIQYFPNGTIFTKNLPEQILLL